VHVKKANGRGGRDIAPLILHHGTRWWVVNFKSRPLYPQYSLNGKLGKPQSQSERCSKQKNPSFAPYRNQTPKRSASSPQSLHPALCWVLWQTYISSQLGIPVSASPVIVLIVNSGTFVRTHIRIRNPRPLLGITHVHALLSIHVSALWLSYGHHYHRHYPTACGKH